MKKHISGKAGKKLISFILPLLFIGFAVFSVSNQALAEKVDVKFEFADTLSKGGLTDGGNIPTIAEPVDSLVTTVLGVSGVGIFLLIIYAGFMWAFAMGNPEKVKKAQQIIISGVIGLIVIFSAYAITKAVLGTLGKATGG